jgi:hypothetical protein
MSKIALSGNASGTGTFTIASPNSNNDRTLNLPDAAGTIQVSGNPISGTTGTFTGLVDISATGAGQIQFPATQNASANANTLDDYEEGTWTPVDGSGAGLSFSTAVGLYTKVGRVVHAQFAVLYPSTASGTRAAIGGLPFAVQNTSLANFGGALGYTDTSLVLGCHLNPGVTTLDFYRNDGQNAANSQLSLKQVRFVVTYFATA